MSDLPPGTDMFSSTSHVRFVPITEAGRFIRSAHRRGRCSFSHREEGADLGRRRLNLNYNGVFDGLQSVEDSFGVAANIARSHDEFLRADSRFHFALHNVGNRFVRVGVKRGADSRRIMDLEECHLVTLDKRLDEHIAAIQRLALDGAYRHSLDVSISRFDHTGLPSVTTPINTKRREPQLHLKSLQHFSEQDYRVASYPISSCKERLAA